MELTFKIPPLPRILAQNKAAVIGCLPSKGARYNSRIWTQQFGPDQDLGTIIKRFPSPIMRDQVASFWNGGPANVRQLFLASMIWGYGTDGVGPFRTMKILEAPNAIGIIRNTVALVAKGRVKSAYESTNIHGLGSAFLTKLLYFTGLAAKVNPLPVILDRKMAIALEKLGINEGWDFADFVSVTRKKSNEIGFVRLYAEGYIRYVNTLDKWAKALGCPRADYIESFLFNLN